MNPVEQIGLYEHLLTSAEKKVKTYVLGHLDVVAAYSIIETARKADVSKSALLRFCQKLGYRGYSEFKYEVSRYLQAGPHCGTGDQRDEHAVVEAYAACIRKITESISVQQIEELCALLVGAGKIKTYGIHESGLGAQYLSYRLASVGIDAETVALPGILNEKASFSGPDDLNIFFSISGMTAEIVEAAATSLSVSAKTVLLTQNERAEHADRFDCLIVLPSFNVDRTALFVDPQAIIFITMDVVINHLAIRLTS